MIDVCACVDVSALAGAIDPIRQVALKRMLTVTAVRLPTAAVMLVRRL